MNLTAYSYRVASYRVASSCRAFGRGFALGFLFLLTSLPTRRCLLAEIGRDLLHVVVETARKVFPSFFNVFDNRISHR